jgi:hypothetical protein
MDQQNVFLNVKLIRYQFCSCEIVALRKKSVDRPESYDSFSAKKCVFLAHGLGYMSAFPYTEGIKKFL